MWSLQLGRKAFTFSAFDRPEDLLVQKLPSNPKRNHFRERYGSPTKASRPSKKRPLLEARHEDKMQETIEVNAGLFCLMLAFYFLSWEVYGSCAYLEQMFCVHSIVVSHY